MRVRLNRREIVMVCALAVTLVLGTQLLAVTAWTADAANQGPGIVILQLSGDSDAKWAVNDLVERLSGFISDDPFFPDRVRVVRTDDPHVAEQLDGQIVIYVSHGGPLGIVTGRYLTPWKTIAGIVTDSDAIMHLFTACSSRNIIRYGDEDSGKKLYTVPGARPAEVTNVEITSTVMLALGLDSEYVDEYRTSELTRAKEQIESGIDIHIMDFEQVILDEIEYIDDHYSDTYTSTHRVYRYSVEHTLSGISGFSELPYDVQVAIMHYYQVYWDSYGIPTVRQFMECLITYTENFYYEANWIVDPEPPPPPPPIEPDPAPDPGDPELFSASYFTASAATGGHWEYGPDIFCGGTYSGLVIFAGDGCDWVQVVVDVTASGPTRDGDGKTEVESIALQQQGAGGIYAQKQKVDGVWQEPVVGRNPYRTGGLWTDPGAKADYEYDSSWPELPYLHAAMKEDAEDGDTSGWHVYDNSPAGYIYNVISGGDRAISLVGGGTGTGYIYPYPSSSYWNDAEHKSIQWSMKYSQSYNIYISVDTTAGHRYIYYTSANYDDLGTGGYVHHGLGSWTLDGKWHTFTRNLQADLHDAQPSVDIIDINAILIRGTGQVDDIMLLDTDYETSGAIHSNGEYIYVNSIPTGSGWHGPSFMRTLPSYFKVEDLGSFSANLSLVHGNNGYRMSKTSVSLFDENKRIVASLMVTDTWGYYGTDAQRQYFIATYYFEDGSYRSYSSDDYSGDTSGVVTIRYDPLSGVFGDVPGETEKFLFVHNQVNPNRIIKYIAVQSYRYSNLDEHDERIYNIRLSYAGSEYTVFHDNCNDMDGFHKDLDFGYGVSSNGEFIVPTGASYMTPTGIPNSPSGWHGPNFVHVLDRPFRLYQLSEFSVIGQLIQSSSTMGKTYVALFDENKQIVMLIHWGDSWVGSQKGYFNVYFYPQNGGSHYQASGYLYSSFEKTGKLWWGEGFGGDGAIYSTIDGSGDAYPIGECDNASRVIKYVVLLGYRYSHYNLVDMRIHDINVVADLNAHDPNAPNPDDPVEHDGTGDGRKPSPEAVSFVNLFMSLAEANTLSWWTGPWPLCHTKTFATLASGASYIYQIAIDILGAITVEGFVIDTPLDDGLDDSTLTAMMETNLNEFLAEAFPVEAVLLISIGLVVVSMDLLLYLSVGIPTPYTLVAYAALLVLYIGFMTALLYSVWDGVLSGRLSTGAAFGLIAALLVATSAESIIPCLSLCVFLAKYWYMRGLQNGVGMRIKCMVLLSLLTVFAKALFIGVMMGMLARIWEMEFQ